MNTDTSVLENHQCRVCGEMVIQQLNNTHLVRFDGDPWILYCANKECDNHEGEGYFQDPLDWVISK